MNIVAHVTFTRRFSTENRRFMCNMLHELNKYFPNGNVPTNHQMKCIEERQHGNIIKRPIAVSTGVCKYGFPQVLVQHPVDGNSNTTQSGMLRLTCPHLVREIDALEGSGGVKHFNTDVAVLEEVAENFGQVNRDWRQIRDAYMTDEERMIIRQKLGSRADHFLNSGIIGIPMGR